MTDKDEPDIQSSGISNEPETAIQTPIATEDKTLLLSDALTNEAIDEPTRKFAAPAGEVQTNHKTEFENEPTKVLQDDSQDDDSDEPPAAPDENALRPNRLRFSLVVLMVVFTAGWTLLNFGLLSEQRTERHWRFSLDKNANGNHVIVLLQPSADEQLRVGDELISINGASF